MGACLAQPLQKVPNSQSKGSLKKPSTSARSSGRYSPRGGALVGTVRCDDSEEEEESDPTQRYREFTSFSFHDTVTFTDEWIMGNEIARGSMSAVYEAERHFSDGNVITGIAKVYNNAVLYRRALGNEPTPIERVKREAEFMQRRLHPSTMEILTAMQDTKKNSLIIFFPRAELGTLTDMVDQEVLDFTSTRRCTFQIAEALLAMHTNGIVHRNISPDAIFGMSRELFMLAHFKDIETLGDDGTVVPGIVSEYSAPEELNGAPYDGKKADVWCFAAVMYFAVFLQSPYEMENHEAKREEAKFPAASPMADEMTIDLLKAALSPDPSKRPTMEEIVNSQVFDDVRNERD